MTPVGPAGAAPAPAAAATPGAARAFPLRDAAGDAAHPFALHLDAARRGLPLRASATAPGSLDAAPANPRARLRKISHEFEAAFIRQMLAAMRQSVPHESVGGEENAAQEMYTSMLDDRLASVAAARSQGGLGDALFRQLSTHLPPDTDAATRSDR